MMNNIPLSESVLSNPAPLWLMILLKVFGFTLHMAAMNLWFVGLPIALYLYTRGSGAPQTFARRLLLQMPIIIALGVNFGIVPLLFSQVAYYRFFYPSTIFAGWFWFSVIVVLTLAYYGVYYVNTGMMRDSGSLRASHNAIGWLAVIGFAYIGFIFSNVMALLSRPDRWAQLWERTGVSGATTGLALNTGDPTVFARWLLMIAISVMTVGAYSVFDAYFLAPSESDTYRATQRSFGLKVYVTGFVLFLIVGIIYGGLVLSDVRTQMMAYPRVIITALAALSPVLTLAVFLIGSRTSSPLFGVWIAAAHFIVLLFNAIGRQVAQNLELAPFVNLARDPVETQWGPLILFLVVFILGIVVVAWLLRVAFLARLAPTKS